METATCIRTSDSEQLTSTLDRLRKVGLKRNDRPQHASLRRASVLVPIFERDSQVHVLLTKRSARLSSHANHVCFPGGKQDEEDKNDDVTTALRETYEEVGLAADQIDPICRLQSVESVNGLCVTPVIAKLQSPFSLASLTLSETEVDAAFVVPLAYFLNEQNCASKEEIEWRNDTFIMRTFFYEDDDSGRTFKIWGLTAAIAYEIALIAFGAERRDGAGELKQIGIMKGYLKRLEVSATGRPFWTPRYYVIGESGRILHQHDTENHASRKASSATKKNRLPLKDCKIVLGVDVDAPLQSDGMYAFAVVAFDGRKRWQLAASCDDERTKWITALERGQPHGGT